MTTTRRRRHKQKNQTPRNPNRPASGDGVDDVSASFAETIDDASDADADARESPATPTAARLTRTLDVC